MTAHPHVNSPQSIEGLTKSNARQVTSLVEMVAEEAGLQVNAIYGPDQDQFSVSFRRALWWCLRNGYGMTYPQIAKLFVSTNGRAFNHSSVISGCNAVKNEGMLVFNEDRGKWWPPSNNIPPSNPRLRQALQIVAKAYNELNPTNQINSWTVKNSQ